MTKSESKPVVKKPSEFFVSPKPSTAIQEMKKRIQGQESQSVDVDEGQLREQEDWSFLATLVVGAEEK
jgi:hypothetical protein